MIDKLPELASFNQAKGIEPDQSLDLYLATTPRPINLFTSVESIQAACDYWAIIGKNQSDFEILPVDNPIQEALRLKNPDAIPLVMHSATDPILFQRMFADGPRFGQLLMSQLYQPTSNHESPSLFVVGIASHGLDIISKSPLSTNQILKEEMTLRRREILGNDLITNEDFRHILQSSSVDRIIAHALGPNGTNISQAMEQYINLLGVAEKTELIVHPKGIEPRTYAEIASKQIRDGVIPIHMECAVYYDMGALFDERPEEVVFTDHHYMLLDAMQLASIIEIEELTKKGRIRI
ncbi:hypothetical protein HYU95_01960, partial [Candidatus Daviesbacteria bacterium]|nr:hypothetical protein [Candidatus Daviesbacteria bacterium]